MVTKLQLQLILFNMRFGKTEFASQAAKNMSFKKFVELYRHRVGENDIKIVFKSLGGKMYAKKK